MGVGYRLAAALAALGFSAAAQAGPIVYNIADLGTVGSFVAAQSIGQSVNDYGQVAGNSTVGDTSGGQTHAFLWANGAMQDLGVLPTGNLSEAFGINDLGQVTGFSNVAGGTQRAFVYENGVMTSLGLPANAVNTQGQGINDAGVVAGFGIYSGSANKAFENDGSYHLLGTLPGGSTSTAYDISNTGYETGMSNKVSQGTQYAVLWNPDGTITNLNVGSLTYGAAGYGVNNDGDVTGRYLGVNGNNDSFARGFLWDKSTGTYQTLGLLAGETNSYGYSVSDFDQVVGITDHPNANNNGAITQAVIWNNGVATSLNSLIDGSLGWNLISAQDISANGKYITGQGVINGHLHAFLLCIVGEACDGVGPAAGAVPEPGSWALMLAGFGLLGGMMRRRGGGARMTFA